MGGRGFYLSKSLAMAGLGSFLWRNKYRLLGGAVIGVGAGLYFGRGYILDKVEKVAIDYQKQMIQDMKDEEELEARKEQFEKVQNQSHDHTLRFLEVLKIYMNGKIEIQSTMEKLKTATKNKQSDQKLELWKIILDLKLARAIASVVSLCIMSTIFRVQFTILHRESNKQFVQTDGTEEGIDADGSSDVMHVQEKTVEISLEEKKDFFDKSFSALGEDLDLLIANILTETKAATLRNGWHGAKFSARVTATEVKALVDEIVGALLTEEGLLKGFGSKLAGHEDQTRLTRAESTFASADGSSESVSLMLDESQHMIRSPIFQQCLAHSVEQGINALKASIDTEILKLAKDKSSKIFLAKVPQLADTVRNRTFKSDAQKNSIISKLDENSERLQEFCSALYEDSSE